MFTVNDWIRKQAEEHGFEWVADNKPLCDEAAGEEIKYETWSRSIRRVRAEFEMQGKSTALGNALEPFEVDTEGKSTLYHDVDPAKWQPDSLVTNTWGAPNNANQQVKVRYKLREELSPEDFAEGFKQATKEYRPTVPDDYQEDAKTELTAEVCLFDFHMGRGSWNSIEDAEHTYMEALSDLFRGLYSHEFNKIIFPIGNDFLDWDNWYKTTTAGTPMRGSDPPDKVVKAGLLLLVKAIDFISIYGEVDVVLIPGNHDWMYSFMLSMMLSSWYRESNRVVVDTELDDWKFRTGPEWLLAVTHGKHPDSKRSMKPEELAAMLPLKAPELWGPNQYREVQTGHLHHKQRGFVPIAVDEMATIVRRIGSLAKQDSFEKVNNYVSNREAELIIFDDRGPRDSRSHRP